jgi:hypothetical protein
LDSTGADMKAKIPDRDDEIDVVDDERAGEVHGVRTTKGVIARQFACAAFDSVSQLHRPRRRPVPLPRLFGFDKVVAMKNMISCCGGEGGTYLRVRQPARDGAITPVPQLGGQVASRFLDEQLHEGARVEVDQRHLSTTLFADEFG